MKCPYCGVEDSKVIDSRSTEEGVAIRRRRECLNCSKRFTTYEKVENVPIMVIKKDLSRQPFDRTKILNGLKRACEKRPISLGEIENIVYEIETAIYNSLEREISTAEIGEMLIEKLRQLDQVAFVRFASVYRDFQDVETFRHEIDKILKK
ncbi:MAG: transcriptional regulator NrdR [Clostridia bacterium]|nr:transcriptional regulator NrdR [Clostridia bacterium]